MRRARGVVVAVLFFGCGGGPMDPGVPDASDTLGDGGFCDAGEVVETIAIREQVGGSMTTGLASVETCRVVPPGGCTSTTQCGAGAYCKNATCTPQLPQGSACSQPS